MRVRTMKKIIANFSRLSPGTSRVKLNVIPGWFVISHRFIETKSDRRKSHGQWFKITSGDISIFRIMQFSANLSGSINEESGKIVLDWSGWLALSNFNDVTPDTIELEITKAKWYHLPYLMTAHPDPSMKLAGKIALFSLMLGIFSIIQAFII